MQLRNYQQFKLGGLMQKLQWFTLDEASVNESLPLMKCVGKVKSTDRKANHFTFTIHDGSGEAEATIYEEEKQYEALRLPNNNEWVIVVGNSYRRQISSKNTITKIKVRLYRIISEAEQQKMMVKVKQSKKSRESIEVQGTTTTKTKRSILKEMKACIEPVEMRSLILSCVYITLENNSDLSSYTFSIYTVQKHRLTKSYIQSKKLKEESIEYLSEFIDAQLKYLVLNRLIEEKEKLEGQTIYIVYREVFNRMEMRILGVIRENTKKGTMLGELVQTLNDERGFAEERNYVVNDNFVQKMLRKFIETSAIYKTSDKVLYPNT